MRIFAVSVCAQASIDSYENESRLKEAYVSVCAQAYIDSAHVLPIPNYQQVSIYAQAYIDSFRQRTKQQKQLVSMYAQALIDRNEEMYLVCRDNYCSSMDGRNYISPWSVRFY